jgi:hypothetical protein
MYLEEVVVSERSPGSSSDRCRFPAISVITGPDGEVWLYESCYYPGKDLLSGAEMSGSNWDSCSGMFLEKVQDHRQWVFGY